MLVQMGPGNMHSLSMLVKKMHDSSRTELHTRTPGNTTYGRAAALPSKENALWRSDAGKFPGSEGGSHGGKCML